ncbi:amiloride-sensitive sodium channel subunit alpha-like [Ylistrum balloti]|uniref:amiloride-sensitive sodium channel subunit alpha-like n=1 Tax=Ylistrum balloti TaxID=509963 RepID=UPI002905F12D|nr:amiloride-sensitive sodium channel subunit alpha-like [Ylistrum balloti]
MSGGDADTLKGILKDLGENTSVHGIPKILTSKNKIFKIFWLLVFMVTFGYLCFQMYALFADYYSYPVETTVSLDFSAIQYPAVTFCNMNPLKKSMLNETPLLLQNALNPRKTGFSQGDNTADADDQDDYYNYDYYYQDEEYQDEINEYFANPNPLLEEYLRLQSPDVPKDKWVERIDKFKVEYRKLSNDQREIYGHQLSDMMVSCSFNKRRCNSSYFHHTVNVDYGNCYTLESNNLVARKAGHLYGLQLILNLEVSEYITSLTSAYGIKLVVHQPMTVPYPSVEGITLSSRQETTMSLKTIEVHRLGGNYGSCKNSFVQDNGQLYSQTSCLNLCLQQNVIRKCKCLPSAIEGSTYRPEYRQLSYCEFEDFKKMVCQFEMEKQQLEGSLNCDCPTLCNEIVYTKTLSSRTWPHDEYLRQFLMAKVCAKNLTSASSACEKYKENPNNFSASSVVDNFLAVNIFFEDVNYEVITESAKYDEFEVLASVGGTLGLFVGASVLSFVEIIQVMLEVGQYLFKRNRKGKTVPEQHIDDNNKTSEVV